MKIIFAGGGTAGHINPSLALAEELTSRGEEVMFVSREGGSENSLITDEGYRLLTYRVAGLKKTPLGILRALYLAKSAEQKAIKILKDETPDIIFATGGYVSYPILKAAVKLKVPAVLHESNAKRGLVTRLLSKKCELVMLPSGYDGELADNEIRVGTPIKKSFSTIKRSEARRSLSLSEGDIMILSLGGSLGAKAVNDAVLTCMQSLSKRHTSLRWIHSAGNRYYDEIIRENPWTLSNKSVKILSYINDMPRLLCASDIVISRCGAVTLSEILESKTPAVLIPSPNVADDHQRKNATTLLPEGSSIIIDESNLSAELLYRILDDLIKDRSARKRMRDAYKLIPKESPREKICSILYSLLSKQ